MNSRLLNPLLHAGVMFVLPVATEWLWWNLGGPAWLVFFEFLILALTAAYLLITPALVVRLFSRTAPEYAQIILPCCLAAIPALFAGMYLRGPLGNHEMAALTHRSQHVLDAIESFEKETGLSPAALEELIPKYLAELPTTGMVSSPSYEYSAIPDQRGQWSLIIRLQPPWDSKGYLIYKPQESYGQNRSDSYCKDVDTWGYKWPEP